MGWNTASNAESWERAVEAWISYLEDFKRRPWTIVQYRSEANRQRHRRWVPYRSRANRRGVKKLYSVVG